MAQLCKTPMSVSSPLLLPSPFPPPPPLVPIESMLRKTKAWVSYHEGSNPLDSKTGISHQRGQEVSTGELSLILQILRKTSLF